MELSTLTQFVLLGLWVMGSLLLAWFVRRRFYVYFGFVALSASLIGHLAMEQVAMDARESFTHFALAFIRYPSTIIFSGIGLTEDTGWSYDEEAQKSQQRCFMVRLLS